MNPAPKISAPNLSTVADLAHVDTFRFGRAALNRETGEVRLGYRFDGGPAFTERFFLDGPVPRLSAEREEALTGALRLLHLAAGISYFKALAPRAIALDEGAVPVETARFFTDLYRQGLGEFAVRNGLDLGDRCVFPEGSPKSPPPALHLSPTALVPVGGGKDSCVTIEALRALDTPIKLFAVNPKGPIEGCIEASGFPAVRVRRQIDPGLLTLNRAGALNGHVPITAIVSLIAVVVALIHGSSAVVMSNERSANVGTRLADGREANHQHSKSFIFERALADELRRSVAQDLTYLSLLRPFSELAIARAFARSERYDAQFSSCNRNFHLNGDAGHRFWCRDCPKCRFVALMLAPFMDPVRLTRIMGGNPLDDCSQMEGFRELVGLTGHKPWECVGEIEESQAALLLLADEGPWSEKRVVADLAPELRASPVAPDATVLERLLAPSSDHALPDRWRDGVLAYLGGQ